MMLTRDEDGLLYAGAMDQRQPLANLLSQEVGSKLYFSFSFSIEDATLAVHGVLEQDLMTGTTRIDVPADTGDDALDPKLRLVVWSAARAADAPASESER